MLHVQNLSFAHPGQNFLFQNLNLHLEPHAKVALVGQNGCGKSTLLHLLSRKADDLASSAVVQAQSQPYCIPQQFHEFDDMSIAKILGMESPILALERLENGNASTDDLMLLDDHWSSIHLFEQAQEFWNFHTDPLRKMNSLSGGEKTKVFLMGLHIQKPDLVFMDEPTNHLDHLSRQMLYTLFKTYSGTILVVSHDRDLLELVECIYELTPKQLKRYGGNYSLYQQQKELEQLGLQARIHNLEEEKKVARLAEIQTRERKQRNDARGKRKHLKAGTPTVMRRKLKNDAQNSAARISDQHEKKIGALSEEVHQLKSTQQLESLIHTKIEPPTEFKNKRLFKAKDINHKFNSQRLWKQNLSLEIRQGERILLQGRNGAGKSTLFQIIRGDLQPMAGTVEHRNSNCFLFDQEYQILHPAKTVLQQAMEHNAFSSGEKTFCSGEHPPLSEGELRTKLSQFLFFSTDLEKRTADLSGGEKLRLSLCLLILNSPPPDIILLDEPTNNLDLPNIKVLTQILQKYQGTLVLCSHDQHFVKDMQITRIIELYNIESN